ncbi:unnamed protein product, partial [Protopolystoma xenopodis]
MAPVHVVLVSGCPVGLPPAWPAGPIWPLFLLFSTISYVHSGRLDPSSPPLLLPLHPTSARVPSRPEIPSRPDVAPSDSKTPPDDDPSDMLRLRRTLVHGGVVEGFQHPLEPTQADRGASVLAFLGIPYALPPVGQLRFAPPIEHPGWAGVRSADRPPPTCWQSLPVDGFDTINRGALMWLNNTEMNEDCLFL